MMTTKRRIREAVEYCAECGLPVVRTEAGGRGHPKIVVRLPDGTTKKVVMSSSSVSTRGVRNLQAFLRRLARGLPK